MPPLSFVPDHPTGLSLFRSILANPDDELARVVFADWLDEHAAGIANGDELRDRAEFIRAGVRLSHLDPWDDETPGLRRRTAELLARYRRAWFGPVLGFTDPTIPDDPHWPVFRRGFPEQFTFWPEDFPRRFEELAELAPVYGVRFRPSRALPAVFASPLLRRVRAASFRGSPDGRTLEHLTRSPHADHLEELDAGRMEIVDWGGPAAGERPEELASYRTFKCFLGWPRLRSLAVGVRFHGSFPQGSFTVSNALEELRLHGGDSASAFEEFAGPSMPRLRALTLRAGSTGVPEVRASTLEALRMTPRLASLTLEGDRPRTAAWAALSGPSSPGLRHLELADCEFPDGMLRRLLTLLGPRELVSLRLGGRCATLSALREAMASPAWETLRALEMDQTYCQSHWPTTLAGLGETRHSPNLGRLVVTVGHAGHWPDLHPPLTRLLRSAALPELREVEVRNVGPFPDSTIRELVRVAVGRGVDVVFSP